MKSTAFTFVFMLIAFFSFSQNFDKNSRTIVKSFNVCDQDILLDIGCDLTVRPWKGDEIRILIEVKLENQRPALIKELVKLNRYIIQIDTHETICFLSLPELNKTVKINGEHLKEFIKIKVLIPESMISYIHQTGAIALSSKVSDLTI